MAPYLFVFLGGGLGSITRFGIARIFSNHSSHFPWATLVANILACIILGILTGYAGKNNLPDSIRYTFMVGFCGGFSTFSTFSGETFKLIEQGNIAYAIVNIIGSIILCIICIYIGMRLVR